MNEDRRWLDFSLEVRYGNEWSPIYPAPNGDMTEILFEPSETLISVTLRRGSQIDGLTFTTNLRTYPHIGGSGGSPTVYDFGNEIVYFSGFTCCSEQMHSQVTIHFDVLIT